ncbi:MAG: rod shape-determining protein RodA [Gammaproteobacteria bacterium]|nr:rod shape-determining protein RodA [Gammaproteobacteria bacterium]
MIGKSSYDRNLHPDGNRAKERGLLSFLRLDTPLFIGLLLLSGFGLVVLYSASGGDAEMIQRQLLRLGFAFAVLLLTAQITPAQWQRWAPFVFIAGLLMLLAVLLVGVIGKGAQRWLDFGLFRFQPSEVMKLALPLVLAWFFSIRHIPPSNRDLFFAALAIALPVGLIAKQPDLGTSLLVASAGVFVLFLGGISWRLIGFLVAAATAAAPVAWHFMHDYQRQRVLTFLDPQQDPLGSGYHIIQSKIAIGSGGAYGKGWMEGTQSHLEFLPERHTDFIFAVLAEELGLFGVLLLLLLYLFIIYRGLFIASMAQDTFSRLLAGSIILVFFVYVFVNIGMVSGMLPVVGVPLPLISYGGTSLVTIMAGFGILMSIHSHKKLLPT